jgi:uncharacterized protein YlzI (FlbEa/FlbD family)
MQLLSLSLGNGVYVKVNLQKITHFYATPDKQNTIIEMDTGKSITVIEDFDRVCVVINESSE